MGSRGGSNSGVGNALQCVPKARSLSAVGPFLWLYKKYFRCETTGLENVPSGRVLLRWVAAVDNEGMYGYQVLRGEGDSGLLSHHASVRERSLRFEDPRVTGGQTYRYAVRPYDLAGNRGPAR